MPLFLGRALPVVVNGFFVAAFALVVGGADPRGRRARVGSLAPLALVIAVCAFSCTGLGLISAALGLLRPRDGGAREHHVRRPARLHRRERAARRAAGLDAAISQGLPITHGIEAARRVADGESLSDVAGLLGVEAAIGVVYGALGYLFIRNAERMSLRHATLDRA